MNIAVVFYSFSGKTERACLFLKDKLIANGIEVDGVELKPQKEETSFFKQCIQAFLRSRPVLGETSLYLDKYDLVVFASPVWAFTFAPALRSYLDQVKGLENKKAACFLTFGSGAGSKRALKELEDILRNKGAHILFSQNIPGYKTREESYLEHKFKPLLEMLNPPHERKHLSSDGCFLTTDN